MGIEGRNESWQRSAYRHQPSTTDRLPVFATLQGYHAFKLKDLGALTQVVRDVQKNLLQILYTSGRYLAL